jgi:protein TonB
MRKLPFSRIRLEPDALERIAYAAPGQVNIEGTVILDAVIARTGEILTLSVASGHSVLAESALESVRHWAYRPTSVNGIPVEVATRIEVTFTAV